MQDDVIIEVVEDSVTPEMATIVVRSDDPVHRVGWEDSSKKLLNGYWRAPDFNSIEYYSEAFKIK